MRPIFIYSLENAHGEFYVSHSGNVESSVKADKMRVGPAQRYLGVYNTASWTTRIHDVFMGNPRSREALKQEGYWKRLLGVRTDIKWPRSQTITGNAEVS